MNLTHKNISDHNINKMIKRSKYIMTKEEKIRHKRSLNQLYYMENKDEILARRRNQTIECACGLKIPACYYNKHILTHKHYSKLYQLIENNSSVI